MKEPFRCSYSREGRLPHWRELSVHPGGVAILSVVDYSFCHLAEWESKQVRAHLTREGRFKKLVTWLSFDTLCFNFRAKI